MERRMHLIIFILTVVWIPWSVEVTLDVKSARTNSDVTSENHVANAINSFGYKLMLKMMNERKSDNIVISPTGIAGLLAMTLLGTVGKTYYEIAKNLGFSQDVLVNRKYHEQLGQLIKHLNANVSSKTLYADAIFVNANTHIRQVYLNYLNYVYHGEALSTDFTHTEESTTMINEWVKNHTEGKIETFLKQPLPVSTKVVLLCALYFNGQWKQPFRPEYTAKMAFEKGANEVMADLMLNFGEFDYISSEKDDLHMIALPYNDSVTTMYALKPRFPKQLNLLELMERLDYEKIDDIINEMTKKECVVRFPKMELATSTNLANTLKALGLQSLFIPGEANFAFMVDDDFVANKTENELTARINDKENKVRDFKDIVNSLPNPGIHVDAIIHDVKMTINEYGTEAVAATSAVLARSAEQFYADSPFYIFIRNEQTKLVTFSAVINDPTFK